MKFTRQSAAAALLAVCSAVSCVQSAAAAGPDAPGAAAPGAAAPGAADAGRAPGAPDGLGGGGPGADGRGPGDGPRHHGFGPSGPGAPGPEMPFDGMPFDGPPFDGAPFHGAPFGPGPLGHLRHLDLSEAQQDKLFAIMHAAAPQQRAQMKAERKAHEALRALGGSPRFDEARANAAARDLGQAIAAGAVLRARIESQVLALLTPAQREQMPSRRPPDETQADRRGNDGNR